MNALDQLLAQSAEHHRHLCPRQVLGVRMGMLAGKRLGLSLPQTGKRLLTFVETDGCFADGVAVSTGCWVGRRSLRVLDYGKVAATFADRQSNVALRVHPHPQARQRAQELAAEARNRWEGYLIGYQQMSEAELLVCQPVRLTQPIERVLSKPSARATCLACREEIINQRELVHEGEVLCRSCAGESYYSIRVGDPAVPAPAERARLAPARRESVPSG